MDAYLIVIGRTTTGYSAPCPEVPGCAAVGTTIEEVVDNMKESLELHMEGMAEDGDPIPTPSGVDSHREVMREHDSNRYYLAHVQVDPSRFQVAESRS
jgi:predicted RNase H-like HicB family nuclease